MQIYFELAKFPSTLDDSILLSTKLENILLRRKRSEKITNIMIYHGTQVHNNCFQLADFDLNQDSETLTFLTKN